MDITGFLLASGFAIVILLLGWSSQIVSKSKETKELEGEFLKKAGLSNEEYKKITQKSGSEQDSLFALVDFLYSRKNESDITNFGNLKQTKKYLNELDHSYANRFWILLFMSMSLFITGIISFFIPANCKLVALLPNLIFIIIIFWNLISVYTKEKKYTDNISKLMEKL